MLKGSFRIARITSQKGDWTPKLMLKQEIPIIFQELTNRHLPCGCSRQMHHNQYRIACGLKSALIQELVNHHLLTLVRTDATTYTRRNSWLPFLNWAGLETEISIIFACLHACLSPPTEYCWAASHGASCTSTGRWEILSIYYNNTSPSEHGNELYNLCNCSKSPQYAL